MTVHGLSINFWTTDVFKLHNRSGRKLSVLRKESLNFLHMVKIELDSAPGEKGKQLRDKLACYEIWIRPESCVVVAFAWVFGSVPGGGDSPPSPPSIFL